MKNQGKDEIAEEKKGKKGTGTEIAQKAKKELEQNCPEEKKGKKGTGTKIAQFPFKKIWDIFIKIATIVITLISIIIIVQKATNNKESFLGYRIFRVQTGSMIPKYNVGDVILVKEKPIDKIKIGDDVTYQGQEGVVRGILITHRVIDIEEIDGKRAFHTQGIANKLEDPIVYGEQINGVVQTKMYVLTLLCTLLNNKYIFYFCGILPLTIYIFFKIFKGKYEDRVERENR